MVIRVRDFPTLATHLASGTDLFETTPGADLSAQVISARCCVACWVAIHINDYQTLLLSIKHMETNDIC
jgi:hypothetical protein